MPNYGDVSYWEERYKNDEYSTFDWLENYSTLKEIISNLNISKENGRILNLGCGNSEFPENMYDDGYHNIKNIDISHNVINLMIPRNKNRPEMTYEVMDVRDLKYESNSFDLAIDKSTIDALCQSVEEKLSELPSGVSQFRNPLPWQSARNLRLADDRNGILFYLFCLSMRPFLKKNVRPLSFGAEIVFMSSQKSRAVVLSRTSRLTSLSRSSIRSSKADRLFCLIETIRLNSASL